MFKPAMSLLFTIALVVTALYFMAGTAAHAAAYRLEPADRPGGNLPDFHGDHTFRYRPDLGFLFSAVSACTKCSALQVRRY